MAYVIGYAGSLESALSACGEPCGRYEYETVEAALATLGQMSRSLERAVTVPVDGDGECLVYASQEEADEDSDGSRAWARIDYRPISAQRIDEIRAQAVRDDDGRTIDLCDDALRGDSSALGQLAKRA